MLNCVQGDEDCEMRWCQSTEWMAEAMSAYLLQLSMLVFKGRKWWWRWRNAIAIRSSNPEDALTMLTPAYRRNASWTCPWFWGCISKLSKTCMLLVLT
jgi:hypothetical protein